MRPRTIAIMQPYFFPYAGYFRLFARSDLFVIYDCVQFPRRGWVHRNRLCGKSGALQWLTLPLQHAPVDTCIAALRFRPQGADELRRQSRRFAALDTDSEASRRWCGDLCDLSGTPVDYLERTLHTVNRQLGLPFDCVRSSQMGLPRDLHGQDRILAIAKELGAQRYVNTPGGRALYSHDAFARQGIELEFLAPWNGSSVSILQRLVEEPPERIADEVRAQALPEPKVH